MIQKITNTIPFDLVQKYASYNSDFCEFLVMEFDADTAKRIVGDYALGSIDGKTICWNITTDGKVLGGRVIGFDENGNIRNQWLESMMESLSYDDVSLAGWYVRETGFNNDVVSISDFLSPDIGTGDLNYHFSETPSLFGLHLLKMHPDRPIALVECHRAALIGAALQPSMSWMATGCNIRDLDVNTLRKLRGKQIIVFPTNHDYYDWCKLAQKIDFLSLKVSHIMQDYQTDWKQDIGDILLQDFRANGDGISAPTTKPQQVIEVQVSPQQRALNEMIERNPSIGLLVSKFDLELIS